MLSQIQQSPPDDGVSRVGQLPDGPCLLPAEIIVHLGRSNQETKNTYYKIHRGKTALLPARYVPSPRAIKNFS